MRFLQSLQPLALLFLRVALGVIFVSHGYPKLTGSGHAMQGFFVAHGLPGWFVYAAGVIEVFGGGLLIIGLFTQAAALFLAIEMALALWKVHSGHSIMAVNEYEFPLSLAAGCLALATTGAGLISIDYPLLGKSGGSRAARNPKK